MTRRTFDHDAALRLHRLGRSSTEIAWRLGVSRTAIERLIGRNSEPRPTPVVIPRVSIYPPWPSKCNPSAAEPLPESQVSAWNRGVGGNGRHRGIGQRPERSRGDQW